MECHWAHGWALGFLFTSVSQVSSLRVSHLLILSLWSQVSTCEIKEWLNTSIQFTKMGLPLEGESKRGQS